MPTLYQLCQLAFALLVAGLIAERVRVLCLYGAMSDEALRWLLRALERSDLDAVRGFTRARPTSYVARVLQAALETRDAGSVNDDRVGEVVADLQEEASARLRVLRVSATLASTMGLLGGILVLARGAEQAGLLALRRGGAERGAMAEAIATMAIGVATSALCFQALALLRPAAQRLLTQTRQVVRALGLTDGMR